MAKTIAIDFDGVIHRYSQGWHNGEAYDQPVEGCFEVIKELMDSGYSVFILSTRSARQIKKWLLPHIMVSEYELEFGGDPTRWVETRYGFTCEKIGYFSKFWNKKHVLGITNRKLAATVYLDDRAMIFNGDWKEVKGQITTFKTYQERIK